MIWSLEHFISFISVSFTLYLSTYCGLNPNETNCYLILCHFRWPSLTKSLSSSSPMSSDSPVDLRPKLEGCPWWSAWWWGRSAASSDEPLVFLFSDSSVFLSSALFLRDRRLLGCQRRWKQSSNREQTRLEVSSPVFQTQQTDVLNALPLPLRQVSSGILRPTSFKRQTLPSVLCARQISTFKLLYSRNKSSYKNISNKTWNNPSSL